MEANRLVSEKEVAVEGLLLVDVEFVPELALEEAPVGAGEVETGMAEVMCEGPLTMTVCREV